LAKALGPDQRINTREETLKNTEDKEKNDEKN